MQCPAQLIAVVAPAGLETQKRVLVTDWRLGLIERCLQLMIFGYVVLFSLVPPPLS